MLSIIRFIAALVFTTALATPAFATTPVPDAQCMRWTHPGSNVNQLTLRETVKTLTKDLPALEEPVYAKYRRTVVLMEDADAALRDSGLPKADQDRIRAQFARSKKQFWGPGGLEKLAIPAELRQTLMIRYIDASAFTRTVMRRGDRIDGFIFERREVLCAIYKPAPGQPEEIALNEIEVPIPNTGDVLVVRHSEVCSNAGKARRAARPTALRAVAAPKSTEGWKELVQWLWLPHELTNQLGISNVTTRTHGKNSRSLGSSFFVDGDSNRPIPPRYEKGDVTVEFIFRDVNYEAARGRSVLVNGAPRLIPADFSREKSGLPVPATKMGTATLSLDPDWKEWIHPRSSIAFSYESFRDKVSYPDPKERRDKLAVIETCVKQVREEDMLAQCGRTWSDDVGELYQLLGKHERSRFHMRMK